MLILDKNDRISIKDVDVMLNSDSLDKNIPDIPDIPDLSIDDIPDVTGRGRNIIVDDNYFNYINEENNNKSISIPIRNSKKEIENIDNSFFSGSLNSIYHYFSKSFSLSKSK